MAYIFFSTEGGNILPTNMWDTNPFEGESLDSGDYIVEYNFDPANEEISSLTLNDAKDTVVNRFAGKTKEEQQALLLLEAEAYRITQLKTIKTTRIKSLIANKPLIRVSNNVIVITNQHKEEDLLKYKKQQGSTGKGIAPCAKDKYGRTGVRINDFIIKNGFRL